MKHIIKTLIKIYALALSPFLGRNCRFQPACSCYAHDAIEKHGSIKGSWMAIKRLLKCHPWNKSDPIDPVP
ncbi:MAG: membrane protein insertion efficiency factor YidD [Bdellovibrionales bacterium]